MKKIIFPLLLSLCFTAFGTISAQDTADGYRIQVLATGVQDKAVSLQSELDNFFPGEVYVAFEDPNYKVRIGNSEDRDAAEMLLLKVQELGYPAAWIVSTTIEIQSAPTLPIQSTEEANVAKPADDKSVDKTDGPGFLKNVGLSVGYPIVTGVYFENSEITPLYGLELETSVSLPLGPLSMGLSADVFAFDYKETETGPGFKGYAVMPKLSLGLNDLPFLPETLPFKLAGQFGAGFYNGYPGTAITGVIEFPLSVNIPISAKLYGRSNIVIDVVNDVDPTGWIDGGLILSYDVSELF